MALDLKKVYQTIVSPVNGNCAAAAVATLFNRGLDEVEFINLFDFFKEEGLYPTFHYNQGVLDLRRVAEYDGGINGYFYASVLSPTYGDGVTHAVIVDKDLNVVHDPNPNQKALLLGPSDILGIITVTEFFIDLDGSFRQYHELDFHKAE